MVSSRVSLVKAIGAENARLKIETDYGVRTLRGMRPGQPG